MVGVHRQEAALTTWSSLRLGARATARGLALGGRILAYASLRSMFRRAAGASERQCTRSYPQWRLLHPLLLRAKVTAELQGRAATRHVARGHHIERRAAGGVQGGMSSDLLVVATGWRLCFAAANHTVKPTPNWCRWLIVLLNNTAYV
jgi:hypothetical protein